MRAGRLIKIILKVVVSAGLIIVLASRMDLENLGSIIGKADTSYLVSGGILYFLSQAISSYRWRILLDSPISFARVFSYYFIGCFFNNFLPTSIGGDVVKTYYIYQDNRDLGHSMASVFLDRYVGLWGLLVIATAGMVSGWDELRETPVGLIYLISIAGLFLASIVMWALNWGAISGKLRVFYEPLMSYKKSKNLMFIGFLISLVIQMLVISGVYLVALGLGLNAGFKYFAILIPLTTLVTMIPVSISGIGVREGAMAYLFGMVGVSVEQAVSMSLIWFVVAAVVNLIGGLEYLRAGSRRKKEQV